MTRSMTLSRRLIALLGLLGAVAAAPVAQADSRHIGGNLALELDERGDVIVLAGNVRLEGRIGGDLAGAAGDMLINADISGDVALAAGVIDLEGQIGGELALAGANVRFAGAAGGDTALTGANVIVAGSVSGAFAAAAAAITIDEAARLEGEADLAAEEVEFYGRAEDSLEIHARTAIIGGEIVGDLEVFAETVSLEPGALVRGDLTVRGPNRPDIAASAQVLGTLAYEEAVFVAPDRGVMAQLDIDLFDVDLTPVRIGFNAAMTVSFFLLGLLASALAPRSMARIAATFRRRPWVSGFVGLVVFALSPLVFTLLSILLILTVLGIPLAIILWLVFIPILCLAYAFGGLAIGDWIFNRSGEPAGLGLRALSLFVALAALAALGVVPVLGWILGPVVLCIGLGAWVMVIFGRDPARAPAPA